MYNHFSGKTEILDAAITRGTHWLQLVVTQALGTAATSEEAVAVLLRSYATFTWRYSAIIDVLINETPQLPDDRRHAARRSQRDFVSDWVRLLAASRPETPEVELRITVQAVLSVINDISRVQHLRLDPALLEDLVAIGLAMQHFVPGADRVLSVRWGSSPGALDDSHRICPLCDVLGFGHRAQYERRTIRVVTTLGDPPNPPYRTTAVR